MSLHEYLECVKIHADDPPFYALIMAAMWKADSTNMEKLEREWPAVGQELRDRHYSPGGLLESEGTP